MGPTVIYKPEFKIVLLYILYIISPLEGLSKINLTRVLSNIELLFFEFDLLIEMKRSTR